MGLMGLDGSLVLCLILLWEICVNEVYFVFFVLYVVMCVR